jgi:hypothetical protein
MVTPKSKEMTTYGEYLRGVLEQIDDSYTVLQNLKDRPGDLEIIKKELAKITGLLQALASKFQTNKQDLSEYAYIVPPMRYFLDNYDFFREVEMISLLYSEDPNRLKNLRLVILDTLDEKNLIGHIKSILRHND